MGLKIRNFYGTVFIRTRTNTEIFKSGLVSQPAIACLKLTIETLEQGVKYVQS